MTKRKDVRAEMMKAWGRRAKFWAEGAKLWAEGAKLMAEGDKLWAEGDKLWAEGDNLWAETILKLVGNVTVKWIWTHDVTVKVDGGSALSPQYRCELGNGMVFEPVGQE